MGHCSRNESLWYKRSLKVHAALKDQIKADLSVEMENEALKSQIEAKTKPQAAQAQIEANTKS